MAKNGKRAKIDQEMKSSDSITLRDEVALQKRSIY
jgi:hypothetical protein